MNIINEISEIISEAFEKCGYDKNLGKIALSNRPDLCQFTCNGAMAGAKLYKKPPLAIANEIVEKIHSNEVFDCYKEESALRKDIFSKIEAVPPGFINISLKNEFFENYINKIKSFDDLISQKFSDKIILDYGGPNVAKPLHIGHLRSAIIGESIKRISKALGYNTIGDIHLGDWGLPMGLIITEIKERYPNLVYFQDNYTPSESDSLPFGIDELNEIYPTASSKSKLSDEYKLNAQEATKKLQNKDIGYYELWKKFVALSIEDSKKIYADLNVDFDLWYGESTCRDYIQKLVNTLIEKGITYESEGALVVDVKTEEDKLEIPPIIIRKSDGAQLYSTTDLATIMQRIEMFDPNQIIYLTDNRQSLHFTQVFRCARKGEILPNKTKLEHIGFGTMNGKDGKPYKTRDGGVMQLSELIKTITEKAYEEISDRISNETTEKEKREIAQKVGIAALKFGDLYNHRSRDYIFDMDRFISFEGKTGPYLLYNTARINSIIKKTGSDGGRIRIFSDTEFDIIFKILFTEDIILRSFNEKAPNYLCEHVYEIASLFSKFYSESNIINEESEEIRKSRISLINLVKEVIISILDLLAIEHVDKM